MIQGSQVGAEPTRVEQILKQMEVVYAEMEPGDGLKFGSGSEDAFLKTFVNPPELKKTLTI